MFQLDDSILTSLNPDARAQLQETIAQLTVTTPVMVYRPVESADGHNLSCLGGLPGTNRFDWPHDKNGKPMVFMAQINFENSNSGNQSLSPKTGILMLFVSVDYSNFRAKDQSWFKVVYEANPESGASRDERPQVDKDFLPVARLVPEVIEHLRWDGADLLMEKFPLLNSLSAGERDKILTWWQKASKRSEARFDDVHQICCSDDEQAREACVRATFYANGISFDQARKVDGHYKHLVDYAAEWEVLWKLAGLNRFLPNEKRQLYICIHRRNLAEFDFSKCAAVFL